MNTYTVTLFGNDDYERDFVVEAETMAKAVEKAEASATGTTIERFIEARVVDHNQR